MRNLGELDLNLLVVFKYLMQERWAASCAGTIGVAPKCFSR